MSLSAIGIISAVNECVTFFQWAKSAISSLQSRWSGSQDLSLQGRVLQFETDLQRLQERVLQLEGGSHQHGVTNLLPDLKDAVAGTKDLLDEFRCYEAKMQVEGNSSRSLFMDCFHTFIQGSISKLNGVQLRLNHISSQLENMGLHGVTQRFDLIVRPETPNETKIFGHDKELKQVLGFLSVPRISKLPRNSKKRKRASSSINASTSTSASNHIITNESRMLTLPVLPIAGLGGVGKSTLAQRICSHQRVKYYFDLIIWICVSDDFDVMRLTKVVIQSCIRMDATTDDLVSLQHALSNHVNNKRLLIVLDDVGVDALKENGQCWKKFITPFRSVQEGSAMLVTTRCPYVAEEVRTMEPIILQGLKDEFLWNIFKLRVFGSESSNNYPELEYIGRRIVSKFKGYPLATIHLGHTLSKNLQASHWNFILELHVWEL